MSLSAYASRYRLRSQSVVALTTKQSVNACATVNWVIPVPPYRLSLPDWPHGLSLPEEYCISTCGPIYMSFSGFHFLCQARGAVNVYHFSFSFLIEFLLDKISDIY